MGRDQRINEIIDQCSFSERNINDSMNIDRANPRQVRSDLIAKRLVDKFAAPKSYKFFYKAAYYMSEDEIWRLYEASQKARITSPIRYFVKSCSKKLEQLA